MGIGRVLGAAAPIAAGYFAGGGTPLFASLGSTGSAIAAGALTGAGIAALSGEDALMGGITGGLGGMTGGAMGTAAQGTKAAAQATINRCDAARVNKLLSKLITRCTSSAWMTRIH
jgi:hypothetical protein